MVRAVDRNSLWRRIYQVSQPTAMQMLSSPRMPKGGVAVSAVHDVPVATTVRVADTAVMERAFKSLTDFEPSQDEPEGVEEIYRRLGSPVEVFFNLAMVVAEGVHHSNYWGLTFSDGMRAITSAVEFMTKPGDEIVIAKPLYGCTDNYFGAGGVARVNRGFRVREVDLTEPENILKALSPRTKIIYFETETNPNLRVYDLETISRLAKGRNPNVILIVDNTFPGPAACNPLLHGADIVVHSGTKVLGGFLQEMAGVAIVPKKYWKDLFLYRKNTGGVSAPDQIHHLLTRGLPSLFVRFHRMQASARDIAEFLASSEQVQQAIYPGLPDYPYAANARKLLIGWNGNFAPGYMVSFIPAGRTEKARERRARAIVDYVARKGDGIITHAVSLGGHQSLIEMPFLGTHATVSAGEKRKWGIEAGMVRMSIGLGAAEDQLDLLERAIRYAYAA